MPHSYDYDSDGKRRSKKKKKKRHKSKSGYGSQPAREREWTPRLIKMRDMVHHKHQTRRTNPYRTRLSRSHAHPLATLSPLSQATGSHLSLYSDGRCMMFDTPDSCPAWQPELRGMLVQIPGLVVDQPRYHDLYRVRRHPSWAWSAH
jgi:hypothetical protein